MKDIKVFLLLLGACLLFNSESVFADSQRIITLGADLSKEQEDTVLEFFGVSDSDLDSIEIVTVTNDEEHELLDSVMPASVIGTHTYSCAFIEPTLDGGINIKTANLTYVTKSALFNALQTAGIENCNLIVTAPFEVSGTGALTGVFKAFEVSGNEVDEDKQEVAAEELIISAELEESFGEESSNMIQDIKEEVVSSDELSDSEIEIIISSKAEDYKITLSSEDIQKLVDLMKKLQSLDYDADAFNAKLNDIKETVEVKSEEAKNFFEKFIDAIVSFFKDLFGSEDESIEEESSETSIFDSINTDVFQFDDEESVIDSESIKEVYWYVDDESQKVNITDFDKVVSILNSINTEIEMKDMETTGVTNIVIILNDDTKHELCYYNTDCIMYDNKLYECSEDVNSSIDLLLE